MNELALTTQDDRSLEQFLAEYEQQKQDVADLMAEYQLATIEELDRKYPDLTSEQQTIYDDFYKSQDFLTSTAAALNFAKASTVVHMENNEGFYGLECVSLMDSPTEYAESVSILSGGFDSEWRKVLEEAAPFHSEATTKVQFESDFRTPAMIVPEIAEIFEETKNDASIQNITVGDVKLAADTMQYYLERYQVTQAYTIDNTLEAMDNANQNYEQLHSFGIEPNPYYNDSIAISTEEVQKLYEEGYRADQPERLSELNYSVLQTTAIAILLKSYEENGLTQEAVEKAQKEMAERDVKVEIVESFDGYVMNTDKPITNENVQDFDTKVEEDGQSVIHNEAPMETTIDPAEVGGRVKLEEYDDLGTVERADGELTVEEQAEIVEEQTANTKKQEDMELD